MPEEQSHIARVDPPFAQNVEQVSSTGMDPAIARLARLQFGVLSRSQLIDLGVAPASLARWVRRGRLHRLVDGVYAVGHDQVKQEGRWTAALLFAGPSACLSHRTALLLRGIDRGTGRIEVIRDFNRSNPRVANTKDSWLTVHRTRSLPAQDLTRYRGFPVTSVARALLDMTPRLSDVQLRKFLAAANRKGIADRGEFHSLLSRRSGSSGIGRFREAVAEWDPLVVLTKSDVEAWFLRLCKKYGIPDPEVNVEIGDFEVDCLWREEKVIVELDTFTYHGGPFAFETDRDRDLILKGMRFDLLRITPAMLENREKMVMDTLRNLINQHRR
ncbi:MAG: type IV toxin-antitoxin system AbiEi family antitoxin domain-containing protein [Solirubrobacterales bacterium]